MVEYLGSPEFDIKLLVRVGSREQGAGSREQGAGSREQGAGSREQGVAHKGRFLIFG
jgi:hypothetical protein